MAGGGWEGLWIPPLIVHHAFLPVSKYRILSLVCENLVKFGGGRPPGTGRWVFRPLPPHSKKKKSLSKIHLLRSIEWLVIHLMSSAASHPLMLWYV